MRRWLCAKNPHSACPVTISYDLETPAGNSSGVGTTVSVQALNCGTYKCKFKASANRECPPDSITLGSATAKVQVTLNETQLDKITIDFSQLFEILKTGLPGSQPVCSGPGSFSGSVSVSLFDKCCEGYVRTNLRRYSGAASVSLGSCQRYWDVPDLSIPHVVGLQATFGGSAAVEYSVDVEERCVGGIQLCGNLSISGTVNGGLSVQAADGVLRASGLLEASGITGRGGWCYDDGISGEMCVGRLDAVITVNVASFLDVEVGRWKIWDGACWDF